MDQLFLGGLGVNPSLTITVLAEYVMSKVGILKEEKRKHLSRFYIHSH